MERIILLTCWLTMICSRVAMADRMVRFIFNNGIPPTPNNECTESDFEYIDPIFNITYDLDRRNRRLTSMKATAVTLSHHRHNHNDRVLRNYPAKCKDNCAGFVPGTCRASGCRGYDGDRRLANVLCETQVEFINDEIDSLIDDNVLSLSCQAFLSRSRRKSECYDDVIYGEIVGFTFFTAPARNRLWYYQQQQQQQQPIIAKLHENVQNGYAICSNIPFNIEIVLNPCVNVVSMTLTNTMYNTPISRIDSAHPMTLFDLAPSSTSYLRSSSSGTKNLPPGFYTLKATPDNFAHKAKTLMFQVIPC